MIDLSGGSNTIRLRLFGPWGEEVREVDLEGHEKAHLQLSELFNVDRLWRGALALEGEGIFTGYFTYHAPESAASLPLAAQLRSELIVPHVAEDNYWWTGLALFNPSHRRAYLVIHAYDSQGREVAVREMTVEARSKVVFTAASRFPLGTSWLRLTSSEPLCGLYLFGGPGAEVLSGGLMD
ncbi:MAG: hypothetical protein DRG33_04360 [Deltaproteobacteria bacterium]|nr:MAG: hypothetical protein DRG33_04360 [Deltaproteobacteria bacterium]